ncbi:MAG: type 4a pilus biogenesis protein PilO [Deltaproteobacteria bacterium]
MKKSNISLKSLAPAIEWIERRTKLQRILIYASLIILLVGGFTYFAYLPKHKQIISLEKSYKQLSAKLEKAKRNAKELNAYRTKMKAAEAQFNIVMKALPEKQEIPALLDGIAMAARDTGLEIMQFQPKNEVVKEFYAEVPLAMQLVGNYHNVAVFFDKIANLPRLVNVSEIRLVPQQNGTKLSTACQALTSKFVEPSEVPKKGSKGKKKKRK